MNERKTSNSFITIALLLLSAGLVVAGGFAFYYAAQRKPMNAASDMIHVRVNQTSCEPMNMTVSAGERTFEIQNSSDRPIEWEILDGVMVVEERENIAPGFRSQLTARLQPGTYDITCGLLTNPRGKLTVVVSAEGDAVAKDVPITAFIGPLSELKVNLLSDVSSMSSELVLLQEAVQANEIEAAKAAWLRARLPYRRIEAFAQSFSDLENAIDALPDYFEKRELDPNFTGFHRIEYGLWHGDKTDGLADYAARLSTDVEALKARLKATKFTPTLMIASSIRYSAILAESIKTGGDNRWGPNDIGEMRASFDGIERVGNLLAPLVKVKAPGIFAAYEASSSSARQVLHSTDQPSSQQLSDSFADMSRSLEAMQTALGLD